MNRSSFPRRQQYRRLRRAAASATASLTAGALAVIAAAAGALAVAGVLLLVTSGLVIDARHWVRLAGRSRVGARSEDEVRRALAPLEAEGWRLRHSLPYRGRGDIDSIAIAPTGIAFAIETKCPDVRSTPSGRREGDGGVAVPPAAALVPPRSAPRPLRRARDRRGASPGRRPDRLNRPPRSGTPRGSRNLTAPSVPERGRGDEDVIVSGASVDRSGERLLLGGPEPPDRAASPVIGATTAQEATDGPERSRESSRQQSAPTSADGPRRQLGDAELAGSEARSTRFRSPHVHTQS